MQTPLSKRTTTGCIGKCTSGLNREELDQITDNVNKTLSHPKGREIFRKYLEQRGLRDNLECLELYETCCTFIEKEQNSLQPRREPTLKSLMDDVATVREMAEDLDGVPQIDMSLMRQFNEALTGESKVELLGVLEETRDRSRDYLRRVHESFKRYASEPCPLAK